MISTSSFVLRCQLVITWMSKKRYTVTNYLEYGRHLGQLSHHDNLEKINSWASFMSKGLCMAELQYKCLCICRQLCFVICHETSNSYLQILSERLIWQQIMQGHAETVVGTKSCAVLHAVKMALWQVYSVIQFNSFSYWNCGVLAFWIRSTIECS